MISFVDLNDFKVVNDTLGHGIGDKLLVAYSDKLAASLRSDDIVPGRLGGDEFGVAGLLRDRRDLSPEARYEGYKSRIIEVDDEFLESPLVARIRERVPTFGISVGFASTLEGFQDGDSLYNAGDSAMYEVKRASGQAR